MRVLRHETVFAQHTPRRTAPVNGGSIPATVIVARLRSGRVSTGRGPCAIAAQLIYIGCIRREEIAQACRRIQNVRKCDVVSGVKDAASIDDSRPAVNTN